MSRNLKEVSEQAMWVSKERIFQPAGTAMQSQKINGKENISAFRLKAINKVVDVITIGERNIISNLGILLKELSM